MCQACKERWWKLPRDKCVAKLDFRQSVTLRACVPSKLRLYANTFLPLGDKGAISSHPLASWLRQWKWSGNNQGRKFRLLQKSVTILSLLNIFLKSVFVFITRTKTKEFYSISSKVSSKQRSSLCWLLIGCLTSRALVMKKMHIRYGTHIVTHYLLLSLHHSPHCRNNKIVLRYSLKANKSFVHS